MASTQVVKGGATVVATKEEAEPMKVQAFTEVDMHNKTPSKMVLCRRMDWSGYPANVFPPSITQGGSVSFLYQSDSSLGGGKGAVQYDGVNTAGKEQCGWILAWDSPSMETPRTPNRVYVFCGPKTQIDAMTWDQIRKSVEMGHLHAYDSDKATNTYADALVAGNKPGMASVNATFGLIN